MEITSNYSTVDMGIEGGNSYSCQTDGSFSGILQEQISKSMSSESTESNIKASSIVNFNLTDRVLDWSEVEARGHYDGFFNDPELRAYGKQLAAENGIAYIKGANLGNVKEQGENFLYLLSQLIDKGLITRQDIIDSVQYPPIKSSSGYNVDMNGFGKQMKGIELTTDLDLFEIIWGTKQNAKAS